MQYISTKKAANLLGISIQAVKRLGDNGTLKKYKEDYSKSILFEYDEVIAFKQKEDNPDWLSRKQACEFLGISEALLSYYIKILKIPTIKVKYGFSRVRLDKNVVLDLARKIKNISK